MIRQKTLCLLYLLAPLTGFSQQALTTEAWFDKTIGLENTRLINGDEYRYPFKGANSHPFYPTDRPDDGSIKVDGQWYPNVRLLFDLFGGAVVLAYQPFEGQTRLVRMNPASIEAFTIQNRSFRKVGTDFMEVMFEGSTWSLLAHRKKTTKVESGRVEYEAETQYFIQANNQITPLAGKKTFMGLCNSPDKINNFIKQNRLKINKSEIDLVALAKFTDTCLQSSQL